jgi:phosphoribosylamine-glycine ligase
VLQWRHSAYAVGVVIASKGYPESSSKGDVITGKGRHSYLQFLLNYFIGIID